MPGNNFQFDPQLVAVHNNRVVNVPNEPGKWFVVNQELLKKGVKEMLRMNDELTVPLRWDEGRDIAMRLDNSVVRYMDWPCIASWNDGLDISMVPMGLKKDIPKHIPNQTFVVHSSSVNIDLTSAPLGYVNYNKRAVYLCRAVKRKQKWGLNQENITTLGVPARGFEPKTILFSKETANTIVNKYPSAEEAMFMIRNDMELHSIAFHRKMAFEADGDAREMGMLKLKHMCRTIGFILPGQERVKIPVEAHRNSLWMREYLASTGLQIEL